MIPEIVEQQKLENNVVPLWHKYTLSVDEAAQYFGVGEKRIRSIINEQRGADFILEVGSHIRIKRVLFEKYLDEASVV